MNTTLDIIPYSRDFHDDLVRMITEVLDEFGFDFGVGGLERDLEQLEHGGRYHGTEEGFWLLLDEGRVIGSVAIRKKDGMTCELKRLYLQGDYRGQGLGQKLYEFAEECARAARYKKIWLDSSRRFKKAKALYLRNGFTLIEELDNAWEDSVYEKAL